MPPLMLDPEVQSRIIEVINYAENNPYTPSKVEREISPGDDPEHTCYIPEGYRCVFTIDFNGAWFRHISISVNQELPPVSAAVQLMKEFGFKKELTECKFWVENLGHCLAINIMEPYDDGITRQE